jgi:hypothetical protein
VACVGALGALVWQTARTTPGDLWLLVALMATAVAIEGGFRLAKRELRLSD